MNISQMSYATALSRWSITEYLAITIGGHILSVSVSVTVKKEVVYYC